MSKILVRQIPTTERETRSFDRPPESMSAEIFNLNDTGHRLNDKSLSTGLPVILSRLIQM